MALEHASPHLTNCECGYCPPLQSSNDKEKQPEASVVDMTRERKDYFDEDSYETASDSDKDRTKKDERIRQAPYLPRIQVWARDSGPYTLRVGSQWFHCDDLLVNGTEYRQQAGRSGTQATRPSQSSNNTPTAAATSKRRPMTRSASYQRTRPDGGPNPRPANGLVRQPSRDKVPGAGRYDSQALPEPPRRKHAARKPEDGTKTKASARTQELGTSPKAYSDANQPMNASSAQLVPYKPATASNPPAAYPARQMRPARPGRLSRNNSGQVPVRSKSKKNVRFAIPT